MSRSYTIYLGCMIPMRFPSVELAAREVFGALGAKVADLEGYTCCPDPVLGRLAEREFSLVLSARNLAMARRLGNDLLVLCNGCFETLVEAEEELARDSNLRSMVNGHLGREHLEYVPGVRIRSFVDALHEDFGVEAISACVKAPRKLKAACHTGCHMLRSPQHPKERIKALELLAAISGAEVVDYPMDTLCCGFPAMTAGENVAIEKVIKPKLESVKASGAEAIVTGCPTCLYQLEAGQSALRKRGFDVNIPVFHVLELLWLSFGADPSKIGLDLHQTPAKELAIEQWGGGKDV